MSTSKNIEFKEGRTAKFSPTREVDEQKEADDARLECAALFGSFFERNADAMSFFDPKTLRYIDGGKINVESQFGSGTVVTVRLPVFSSKAPAALGGALARNKEFRPSEEQISFN